jgi:hypothetical protein
MILKGIEAEAKFENRNAKLEGQEEAKLEMRNTKRGKGFWLEGGDTLRCEEKSLQTNENKGVEGDYVGQRSL